MLIRITNKCRMQCSHCMIDGVSPKGEHMTKEIFLAALAFAEKCGVRILLISGGEPTEHPDFAELLWIASRRFVGVMLATNGMWLDNAVLVQKVASYRNVLVQITNDPRFYPKWVDFPENFPEELRTPWEIVREIPTLAPSDRVADSGMLHMVTRHSPGSFNLRSAVRQLGLAKGITELENRGRFCQPSIDVDGTVRAGEADTCFSLGDVTDPPAVIEYSIKNMGSCNACGLEDNLDNYHRAAIGLPRLEEAVNG